MDGGRYWNLFQGDIPNVAIYYMVIQSGENYLEIGTRVRDVYVVDLDPIHELAKPTKMVMEK